MCGVRGVGVDEEVAHIESQTNIKTFRKKNRESECEWNCELIGFFESIKMFLLARFGARNNGGGRRAHELHVHYPGVASCCHIIGRCLCRRLKRRKWRIKSQQRGTESLQDGIGISSVCFSTVSCTVRRRRQQTVSRIEPWKVRVAVWWWLTPFRFAASRNGRELTSNWRRNCWFTATQNAS